mgnify:CR=1 FL=1
MTPVVAMVVAVLQTCSTQLHFAPFLVLALNWPPLPARAVVVVVMAAAKAHSL